MKLVIDASVALSWCFHDGRHPYSVEVLDLLQTADAVVPAIWPLELANSVVIAERRGRITTTATSNFIALIEGLGVQVDPHTSTHAWRETLSLARRYDLTAYDAAYLELAVRERLSLATLDEALAKAARKLQVPPMRGHHM